MYTFCKQQQQQKEKSSISCKLEVACQNNKKNILQHTLACFFVANSFKFQHNHNNYADNYVKISQI